MTTLARCAAVAATALAVIAPIAATGTAQASVAKRWTTIETLAQGKQQACKVSSNRGTTWTIYNRLDARPVKAGSGPLESTLTVTLHGKPTTQAWDSHWVQPGHLSTEGRIVLPRKAGYALMMTIHGTDFGSGGVPSIAKIGLC